MSNVGDSIVKILGGGYLANPGREIATAGWQLWIKSATGEEANVVRTSEANIIQWKPGQADKFAKYFDDLIFKREDPDAVKERGYGFGEVSIDWKPVFSPLVLKRVLPVTVAFAAIMFYVGRMSKRRK